MKKFSKGLSKRGLCGRKSGIEMSSHTDDKTLRTCYFERLGRKEKVKWKF